MGIDGEASGGRRRTGAERRAIVAEAFSSGHSVGETAERHGVSPASIYLWRRQARDGMMATTRKRQGEAGAPSPVTLVPVRIAPAAEAGARADRIGIRLANGRVLEACEGIDPGRLVRLVAALESEAP